MSTEEKNQDGTQTENEGGDVAELTPEQITELQEKAGKVEEMEKELGSTKRDLKKANKAIEETKKAVDPEEKDTPEETPQSNEPDYAKLAYLKSNQIEHPDDQKAVMDEAERLKLPLTDVLQMEHIQVKLKSQGEERTAQDGMPEGSNRQGGANKGEVDYYIANPEEQPPSDNLELANKVIDAKVKKEENANMFSKDLY